MSAADSSAIFQVFLPEEQPVADPFDIWQVVSYRNFHNMPGSTDIVWRAELPSDPLEAGNALRTQAIRQRSARQALDAAPRILTRDLNSLLRKPEGFSLDQQEAGSNGALRVLEQARQYTEEQLSFSVLDDIGVTGLLQAFDQFINQVQFIVGQFALVESARDGRLLCVTRVAWAGGIDTWSGPHAGALEVYQHTLILKSALAMRQDWLHFLTVLTSVVIRISVALTLSPFNPLAIWAAWSYIQEILEEYHRLHGPAAQPN